MVCRKIQVSKAELVGLNESAQVEGGVNIHGKENEINSLSKDLVHFGFEVGNTGTGKTGLKFWTSTNMEKRGEGENGMLYNEEVEERSNVNKVLNSHLLRLHGGKKQGLRRPKVEKKNTKYFHKMAKARGRTNDLLKLCSEGVLVEDKDAIANLVVGLYKNLYKEPNRWRPRFLDSFFAR
ncbi:hypothetical protein IFM89_033203 [Coptis chinensis]|uniref:Uncharacterized protein n=1 Tax=Coptis chinensis TaxID=261450 RepID=A0A835IZR6_9MAGN|nr:hypothetical protein IFM89_033203 [Coptis chinensis]